jgi:hypothetical protein
MKAGSVSFAMSESFGANNASIQQLLMGAANNRGVQAHGKITENCIAAFLIGAGYRAYFGAGGWSETTKSGFKDRWSPIYDFPLGPPHSDAQYDATTKTWTRSFGGAKMGGVTANSPQIDVTFKLTGSTGTIKGWTFPTAPTPSPQPPQPPLKPTKQCPTLSRGIGYSHGDMGQTTANTWADCCADCAAMPGCAKWVFAPENAPQYCHLHNANAKANDDGKRIDEVSGVMV